MRLIDADALTNKCGDWYTEEGTEEGFIGSLKQLIYEQPTIDAVPVVRCKDCKWWTKQEKSIQGRCALNGTYPAGGWYCANGRKERR